MKTIQYEASSFTADCPDDVSQQYGVLPWRKDKRGAIQLLLITSRRRRRWIVPKGWPVESRAPYMAAALEAFEEAGVIGEVWPSSLADYHYMKESREGAFRRCRVSLFPFRVRGTLTHWPERGDRQRRWFPIAEAAELVDDAELANVIRMIDAAPQRLTGPKRFPVDYGQLETSEHSL